jgi:hypothetical protein
MRIAEGPSMESLTGLVVDSGLWSFAVRRDAIAGEDFATLRIISICASLN